MKLDCYRIHGNAPEIVPARPERLWMDRTPDRFGIMAQPPQAPRLPNYHILALGVCRESGVGGASIRASRRYCRTRWSSGARPVARAR